MKAMYFAPAGTPSFTYNYNGATFTTSSQSGRVIGPVCLDVSSNTSIDKTNPYQAGASFFCNAEVTSSFVPCIEYQFYYDSIGCGSGGSATSRYYDCSGNLITGTVSSGNSFYACATSFGSQPCVLTAATGNTCTSFLSIPSQCCISSPPQTGPEAWVIEVVYPRNVDLGTCYFNYIDKNGDIINDTLTYAEYTKRITAQSNPLIAKPESNIFDDNMKWNVIEKFPGQVLKYPFFNTPAIYTFQLKRDDPTNPGTYYFPYITYWSGSTNATSYIGQIYPQTGASLNATINLIANNPPIDAGSVNNRTVPCVWITNVTAQPKTAFNLVSCQTTHSLWTTLDNYDSYTTGSVLKVTNTELTTTSSCWTVSNLTSSLSVSVALTNVNVTQSYSAGFCVNCLGFANEVMATGGTSGSFLSGSTLYKYNAFTTSGTFNIVTGSITNGKLMVIAGGGGGGNQAGAGAGGVIYSSSVALVSNTPYTITVGTGGAAYNGTLYNQNAANGINSTFSGSGFNLIAIGGGAGASFTGICAGSNGGDGGSGGGGNCGGSPGSGTSGQGYGGGSFGTISGNTWSGGGGGAAYGGSTRYGGAGIELGSAMFNVAATYAAGGNVSAQVATTTSGSGGTGGGGATSGQTGRNGLVVITYPAFS
jgi:hypothetical protein